jgi:hypothetical protein
MPADVLPQVWNGTLREHYLLLFGVASGLALLTGFVGAWIGSHIGARRGASRALHEARVELRDALRDELAAGPTALEMHRFGRTLDALALEVERVAEAQRYSARLLTERAAHEAHPAAPRRDPEHTTPL